MSSGNYNLVALSFGMPLQVDAVDSVQLYHIDDREYISPAKADVMPYKGLCNSLFTHQQHIPLHISHMDTFRDEAEGATITIDSPLADVYEPQSGLSELEDSASSASESFSDDDMYPACYDDEPAHNGSHSINEAPSSAGPSV